MNKLFETISELIGVMTIAVALWIGLHYLNLIFEQRLIVVIIAFIILDVICILILNKLTGKAFQLATRKSYNLSIFLSLLIFWYNIDFFIKFIVIVSGIKAYNDTDFIQRLFYDSNPKVVYAALWLYAINVDPAPVNQWFEDNYISKNIPIDSTFQDIYKALTNQLNQNA